MVSGRRVSDNTLGLPIEKNRRSADTHTHTQNHTEYNLLSSERANSQAAVKSEPTELESKQAGKADTHTHSDRERERGEVEGRRAGRGQR